jgi:hypothetical protein
MIKIGMMEQWNCHKPGISDQQQSWGYEDGPWKGPRPPLLGDADF